MPYLDFASSTPTSQQALDAMLPFLTTHFGNPSSIHAPGLFAKAAIEEARLVIAECLGAHEDEIFFTSGTTESINLALHGHARVVYSATEHDATRACAKHAPSSTSISVDTQGLWSIDDILQKTFEDPANSHDSTVISVSWVNNELGSLHPIHDLAVALGKQKQERRVYVHVDAAQAFNDCDIDLERTPLHALSFGSSKVYGPKGVGALFLRRGTPRSPILFGGKQQSGLRPGTENVAGIVGFAEACRQTVFHRTHNALRVGQLSELFLRTLQGLHIAFTRNGPTSPEHYAPHILNLTFPNINAEELLLRLDAAGVYVSAASACRSGSGPSDTLRAIGLPDVLIDQTLRFSFGHPLSEDEIIEAATLTANVIKTMLSWNK